MLCAYLFCVVLANFFSFQNGTTEDVTSEEEEEEEIVPKRKPMKPVKEMMKGKKPMKAMKRKH